MAELPAVVAMQRPISDAAAITFSRAVHLRLAAGETLDTAVTEGRQAIFASDHSTMEWAIPVLFTRIGDGLLFDPQERRAREASPDPVSRPGQRRLRKLLATGVALLLGTLLLWALLAPEAVERALPALPRRVEKPAIPWVQVGSVRISRYEVTQRQFLQFVLAKPQWRRDRIEPGLHDGDYLKSWISWRQYPPRLDDHPVSQVSWYAAEAFCEWIGGRLPRLKEWQAAAHTAEHRFPWHGLYPWSPFCVCSPCSSGRESGGRPAASARVRRPWAWWLRRWPATRAPSGRRSFSAKLGKPIRPTAPPSASREWISRDDPITRRPRRASTPVSKAIRNRPTPISSMRGPC